MSDAQKISTLMADRKVLLQEAEELEMRADLMRAGGERSTAVDRVLEQARNKRLLADEKMADVRRLSQPSLFE